MWIECGIINYKFIIPLIYPVFYQIRLIIHKGEQKPLLKFFTNYLGYLFSGLIYLIIKYRMKKVAAADKNINNNDPDTIILELNDVLIPNLEEKNEISISPFMKVKSIVNQKTIKKANNQIELEREKIQKKKFENKTFIYTYFIYYLFNSNVIRCF